MNKAKITLSFSLVLLIVLCFSVTANAAIKGDADGDGVLSAADAQSALKTAIRLTEPTDAETELLDVDRDGYVTTEDARIILRSASGLERLNNYSYTKWVTVTNPDCTNNGYAICSCIETGEQKTKILTATGHSWAPADCTSPETCRICAAIRDPALGHTTVAGVCTRCNQMIQDAVAANIYGKEIPYGATALQIISLIGQPQEMYADNAESGPVQILVYTADPSLPDDLTDLAVFFVSQSGLSAVYTTDTRAEFTDGLITKSIGTDNYKARLGDNVLFITYLDKTVSSAGIPYAVFAYCEGYTYQLNDSDNLSICEKLIFHTTNALRAKADLEPLTYCDKAASAAYSHSKYMADTGDFDHEESDGSHAAERLDREGIEWYAVAENIFGGTGYDPFMIADGWYNSPSHRRNILSDIYNRLGVGIAYSNNPLIFYATQNFYRDFPLEAA